MLPKFPLVRLLWASVIAEPNIESMELRVRVIIIVHVFVCMPLKLHVIINIRKGLVSQEAIYGRK
jgi:hypothetical protein